MLLICTEKTHEENQNSLAYGWNLNDVFSFLFFSNYKAVVLKYHP